jgi:methyl-accepting chemotaxis protein
MTEENKPEDFTFGKAAEEETDEVLEDIYVKEEIQDRRIASLSRRLVLLALLVPLFIGVVLFFFYLDLKKRVILYRASEVESVDKLSQNLDTRLGELAERVGQMETTLTERFEATEKNFEGLKFRVYKAENELKKTAETAQKASAALATLNTGMDQLTTKITNLEKNTVDPAEVDELVQRLNELTDQVAALNDTYVEKFTTLAATVEKADRNFEQIRDNIAAEMAGKLDRGTFQQELDEALQQLRRDQQQQRTTLVNDLDRRLVTLEKDIIKLERNLRALQERIERIAAPPRTSSPSPPASGSITEKDIQ